MSFHIVLYWRGLVSRDAQTSVFWERPLVGVYLAGGNGGAEYELLRSSQAACLDLADCFGVT